MRRVLELGGYAAGAVLLGLGIAALVIGLQGRSQVHENVAREDIVGTSDMTPSAIREEVRNAGITVENLPDCSVAGKKVTTGDRARCFAEYMRVHALLATGGKTYAEMARYVTPSGEPTNDPSKAEKGPNGSPKENTARNVWVTETALSTALNMAYFAEQVSNFSIVVAIALILGGLGFGILAFAVFRWLPARERRLAAAS